jgi:hypothetical protein
MIAKIAEYKVMTVLYVEDINLSKLQQRGSDAGSPELRTPTVRILREWGQSSVPERPGTGRGELGGICSI